MYKFANIISTFAIVFKTITRKRVNSNHSKNVLIVFQQIFGDSVVFQSSLQAYVNLFNKQNGYTLYLLARPSVMKFMKNVLYLPKEIIYEEVDFQKLTNDYQYYKFIVNKYKKLAGITIVPGTSLSAEIFSCAMDSSRKIGLVRPIKLKNFVLSLILNKAYTEKVVPEKEEMMFQRHQRLINYLGEKQYVVGLPCLLIKDRLISNDYAVISPGASKTEKCWPIERFSFIADYLIKKYNLDIHVCGGKGEESYASKLKLLSTFPNRIISHVGITSFSDWSAIIQHSKIVVGNDSATVHLAAAGRVPAVCISGVYDKYQFFPYKLNDTKELYRLPITVMSDNKCEFCRTYGYFAGYNNKICKKAIKDGNCTLCISKIEINQVVIAIDYLLS